MEYKQAIVLRKDLELSKGKAIAQAVHAGIAAMRRADREDIDAWTDEGGKKVVLEVKTLEEMQKLFEAAKDMGLPASLIRDAGLTEIPAGTITALGIGPAKSGDIDKLTGKLPLVK